MLAKKPVGGDWELQEDKLYRAVTDSGRSSLRLILRSGFLGKRVIIPDFICSSVLRVFEEEKIDFGYYRVGLSLLPEVNEKDLEKYDAFYLIDYFGIPQVVPDCVRACGMMVISDQVYSPTLREWDQGPPEFAFNSFRKVSPVPEGSMVESLLPLRLELVNRTSASFVELKYQAKYIKYNYINNSVGSENDFLELSAQAEALLDSQKGIFSISTKGMIDLFGYLSSFETEQACRLKNFNLLETRLISRPLFSCPPFPSYFVIALEARDALRHALFRERIFLPVHWPKPFLTENPLYDRLLLIPLDSRYGDLEMDHVASCCNDWINMNAGKNI